MARIAFGLAAFASLVFVIWFLDGEIESPGMSYAVAFIVMPLLLTLFGFFKTTGGEIGKDGKGAGWVALVIALVGAGYIAAFFGSWSTVAVMWLLLHIPMIIGMVFSPTLAAEAGELTTGSQLPPAAYPKRSRAIPSTEPSASAATEPSEGGDLEQFLEGLGRQQRCEARPVTYSGCPEPAGFWIRVGATLIDDLIFLPLAAIAIAALSARNGYVLLLVSLPGLVYKPFMQSYCGATLGKMACGLKVIDRRGENMGLWRAYVRFFPFLAAKVVGVLTAVWLISTSQFWLGSGSVQAASLIYSPPVIALQNLLGFAIIIDCVFAAFSRRKCAVHDMIAGSFCIRVRRAFRRQKPSQAETRGFLRSLESEA